MSDKNPRMQLAAYKNWCARRHDGILAFIKEHEAGIAPDECEDFETMIDDLKDQFARLTAKWDEISDSVATDTALYEELDKVVMDVGKTVEDTVRNARRFLKKKLVQTSELPPVVTTPSISRTHTKAELARLGKLRLSAIAEFQTCLTQGKDTLARYKATGAEASDFLRGDVNKVERSHTDLCDAFKLVSGNIKDARTATANYLAGIPETEEPANDIPPETDLQTELINYRDRCYETADRLANLSQSMQRRSEKAPPPAPPSKKEWKANKVFEPKVLQGFKPADLKEWITNLMAYITPADITKFGGEVDFRLICSHFLADGVRQAIKFDPADDIPIFETTEGTSLVRKLKDLWGIRNPKELLRAHWFGMTSYEDEDFTAFDGRVVTLAKEADIRGLVLAPGCKCKDADRERPYDAIIGNKLLTGLVGTRGDLIRDRVLRSDVVKDGIVLPEMVRKIARSEEAVLAHSKQKGTEASMLHKVQAGKPGGQREGGCHNCHGADHIARDCPNKDKSETRSGKRGPSSPWFRYLQDHGLCRLCAKSHDKPCNPKQYRCKHCDKAGHLIDACGFLHADFKAGDTPKN